MEPGDIFVAELMTSELITATPETLVEDAADILLDHEIGSLVIVGENNQPVGILTGTDFIEIVSKSDPKAETTVERYMTTEVVTIGPQDSIREAASKMGANDIQHLPVSDPTEGVVGMLSSTDLTNYLSE